MNDTGSFIVNESLVYCVKPQFHTINYFVFLHSNFGVAYRVSGKKEVFPDQNFVPNISRRG